MLSRHNMPSVPPRLLASQLRDLLRDPGNERAVAAGRQLIDQFVHDYASASPEALREKASALMAVLMPGDFDATSWNAPASATLRRALGPCAVVFETLQAHMHRRAPPRSPRSLVPPMPAELTRLKGQVLTITGELLSQERVPLDLAVLTCSDVGIYTQKQWSGAAEELKTLAPLLPEQRNKHLIVRRILLTAGDDRQALMEAFTFALKDRSVNPDLRHELTHGLTLVRPALALSFARVVATGFEPLIGSLTLVSGVEALARLPAATLNTLLLDASRYGASAQWLASIAMVLAGQPDDPAHRSDMALLLAGLAPSILLRVPESAMQLLERIASEPANRQGLVQAAQAMVLHACISSDAFVKVMGALQEAPAAARMGVAMSLSTYRVHNWDEHALTRVVRCLAKFDDLERDRFVRKFSWLMRGARNIEVDIFADIVERMAAYPPGKRDDLDDLMNLFCGAQDDLVQRAHRLRDLAQMDDDLVQGLHRLGGALPKASLGAVIEAVVQIPVEQRAHVVDCVLRLAPPRSPRAPDIDVTLAIRHLGSLDTIRRELAASHMQALGFDLRLSTASFVALVGCLCDLTSDRRAAVVRAFRQLVTPALAQGHRHDMLLALGLLQPTDLPEFVQSCRFVSDWENLGANRLIATLSAMSAVFLRGERVNVYNVVDPDNVHRGMFTRAAIDSILALREMRHLPTTLETFVGSVEQYIKDLEEDTPEDNPDRQVREGRTATLFDDARRALNGAMRAGDYSSFADNDEDFQVDGQDTVFVGDLANHVWQSILTYPENAVTVPLDQDDIDADKVAMGRNFVVQLAACIEDDQRVCYAGKTMRILESVQGFIKGVGIDDLETLETTTHLPDESMPTGALLLQESIAFSHRFPEPSLTQIEAFVAKAIAAGEQQWSAPDSDDRRTYLRDLSSYVELTFENFGEVHPNIWDGLTDATPRPSSPATP